MIALARTIALATGGLCWGLILAFLAGFAAFRVKTYVEQRLAIRRALRWVNANRRPRALTDVQQQYDAGAPTEGGEFVRPMGVPGYVSGLKEWKNNQGLNAYRYTELDDLLREAGLTSEVEGE